MQRWLARKRCGTYEGIEVDLYEGTVMMGYFDYIPLKA